MPTYYNCYSILEDVRIGLNENSTAYVQGTDTTGRFLNSYLVGKINEAQRFIYALMLRRQPGIFTKTAALTGVDSVYTLPADFGVLLYFKDENGRQVFPIGVKQKRLTNETGSDRHYYRKGNTLVLDKAGLTTAYSLEYLFKCRDLTQGTAQAGAATSITLATTASKLIDFYNEVVIENITQDWVDTIDDYATTRVATISETAVAADFYGTVSDLPEPFHHLIASRAILNIKAINPLADEKPDAKAIKNWNEEFISILSIYAGAPQDVSIEDIFTDFSPSTPYYGIIVS